LSDLKYGGRQHLGLCENDIFVITAWLIVDLFVIEPNFTVYLGENRSTVRK